LLACLSQRSHSLPIVLFTLSRVSVPSIFILLNPILYRNNLRKSVADLSCNGSSFFFLLLFFFLVDTAVVVVIIIRRDRGSPPEIGRRGEVLVGRVMATFSSFALFFITLCLYATATTTALVSCIELVADADANGLKKRRRRQPSIFLVLLSTVRPLVYPSVVLRVSKSEASRKTN